LTGGDDRFVVRGVQTVALRKENGLALPFTQGDRSDDYL
jgi:hypothetical protein